MFPSYMRYMSILIFYILANDRCIVGIYIFRYKPYVIFSFSGLFWTTTCLIIHIGVVNQCISQKLQKIIKSSSILSKYFISRYVFTSVHDMKNKKLGWATRWFPMQSPKQFGTQSRHHFSVNCGCPLPPCIYNYQQQHQVT